MKKLWEHHNPPVLPTAVIAETWRGNGPRSTLVARAINICQKVGLDEVLAKQAGELLRHHGSGHQQRRGSLVVDAIVVMTAVSQGGGLILTSDPGDIGALAEGYPHLAVERV